MKINTNIAIEWQGYAHVIRTQLESDYSNSLVLVDAAFADCENVLLPLHQSCAHVIIAPSGEPTTLTVNALCAEVNKGFTSVVGIGGGSVIDLAKAVAVTSQNGSRAEQLQGWDIPQQRGLPCMVVPTLPGTGAEVSRTAVLKGPERKLGINSDFSMPTFCFTDPSLFATVSPKDGIPTLMDCLIHCVEVVQGHHSSSYSRAASKAVIQQFDEIFAQPYAPGKRELAESYAYCSYMGGVSLLGGTVGACHALAYGLSHALEIRHSVAVMIAMEVLEDIYGDYARKIQDYCALSQVDYWSEVREQNRFTAQIPQLVSEGAMFMQKLWVNVCGNDENWETLARTYTNRLCVLLQRNLAA